MDTITICNSILTNLYKLETEVPEFARKIEPIFKLLDWRWCGTVPTYDDICNLAYHHISTMVTEMRKKVPTKPYIVSSGGITLTVIPHETWDYEVKMEFIAASISK